MRAALESVVSELEYLRDRGVSRIFVHEDTMAQLHKAVEARSCVTEPEVMEAAPSMSPVIEWSEPQEVQPKAKKEPSLDANIPEPESFELPAGDKQTQWNWLRERVLGSPECLKHVKPGKKVVFGVGNLDAEIFFCGEAPGADEEIQGEPFVGKAGQLLTKIIGAMGYQRQDVYIGNIMNWRPEMPTDYGNRPPTQREMQYCLPFLKAQLEIVKPKAIVALGATAVSGLLGPDPKRRMKDARGQWSTFDSIPLMVTFHPSYLLRNNTNKAKRMVWEDMLKVMEHIDKPITEKQRSYFL